MQVICEVLKGVINSVVQLTKEQNRLKAMKEHLQSQVNSSDTNNECSSTVPKFSTTMSGKNKVC